MDFLLSIIILIGSVIIHEVSHGFAAFCLGDPTAKQLGRLSLNPIRHLDPVGSLVVPILAYFTGGFIFGWAKPIPYDPRNIRQPWGEVVIALAGPLSNIALALLFGLILRFGMSTEVLSLILINVFTTIVFVNLILAIFNLMPIPPLDGSKILYYLMGPKEYQTRIFLEKYGIIFLLFFIFFLWKYVIPVVVFFFSLITGILL